MGLGYGAHQTQGHQLQHRFFSRRKGRKVCILEISGRDYCVMVGYFLIVDYRLRITGNGDFFAKRHGVDNQVHQHRQAVCHITGQIAAVSTGIGAELLFIQALQIVQGLLGRKSKQTVGISLQGSQVIEGRRLFGLFLALHLFDRDSCTLAGFFQLLSSGLIRHAIPGYGKTGQLKRHGIKGDAGRGIGSAIAKSLAKEGATVIVNYAGNAQAAQDTVDSILKNGGSAEKYQCDVSDFAAVEEMIKYVVQKYEKIDILVNNAGITKDGLLLRMSEQDFKQVLAVNLGGTFHCIRHAAKYMIKQRSGRIINLASVVGLTGNAGQANYAASKAGVIGLTKSAAKELASRQITVNAIAPGYIDTDMTAVLSDSVKESVQSSIPLKRMGTAQDIAQAAVFLASDKASYITGQVLSVNGGMV